MSGVAVNLEQVYKQLDRHDQPLDEQILKRWYTK